MRRDLYAQRRPPIEAFFCSAAQISAEVIHSVGKRTEVPDDPEASVAVRTRNRSRLKVRVWSGKEDHLALVVETRASAVPPSRRRAARSMQALRRCSRDAVGSKQQRPQHLEESGSESPQPQKAKKRSKGRASSQAACVQQRTCRGGDRGRATRSVEVHCSGGEVSNDSGVLNHWDCNVATECPRKVGGRETVGDHRGCSGGGAPANGDGGGGGHHEVRAADTAWDGTGGLRHGAALGGVRGCHWDGRGLRVVSLGPAAGDGIGLWRARPETCEAFCGSCAGCSGRPVQTTNGNGSTDQSVVVGSNPLAVAKKSVIGSSTGKCAHQ